MRATILLLFVFIEMAVECIARYPARNKAPSVYSAGMAFGNADDYMQFDDDKEVERAEWNAFKSYRDYNQGVDIAHRLIHKEHADHNHADIPKVDFGHFWPPSPFGEFQSPINLVSKPTLKGPTHLMKAHERRENPITFDYPQKMVGCSIKNNGHTVQVNIPAKNKATMNIHGKTFTLSQFHFHTPSEHTIDSQKGEMELHLVHTNDEGAHTEYAVFGFIFTTNQQQASLKQSKSGEHLVLANEKSDEPKPKSTDFLAQFWDELPGEKTAHDIPLTNPISFESLFECSTGGLDIFEYKGSLTTPPFTEGVNWMVSKQIKFINDEQLKKLSAAWGHQNNARPVQGNFGRTVNKHHITVSCNFEHT